MDNSPRGHKIEKISGDATSIVERGTEMESLGMQMRESAAILEKIKNGAEGKGYSMEKIKDNVGDLHNDLSRAGERYEPSGTAVRKYGEALSSVQPTISTIVDNCETLWAAYQTALGDLGDATSVVPPVGETPEQKTEREKTAGDLTTAKDNAYEAWQAEASRYDTPYDTWDNAYEDAVSGLKKANDDGVKDSFWDNALPFIEGALTVLTYVGIALAVVALIVGGPILAAIAAVVALATLALTIWKVAAGRGGKMDIILAVVGVIPFGRLAKLGGVFRGSTTFGNFMKGFGSDMIGLTGVLQRRAASSLPALISRTGIRNAAGELTQSPNIIRNVTGLGDDIADLGRYATYSHNPSAILNRITGGGSADLSAGMTNAFADYSSNVGRRVDNFLSGSPISGMQNAASGAETFFNVLDTVAKPLESVRELVTQPNYDTDGNWAKQLTK